MRHTYVPYQKCLTLYTSAGRFVWLLLSMLCLTGVLLAAASVRGHGICVGTVVLTPSGDGLVDIQIDTVGNITHLGRSTVRVHSTANFGGSVPVPVPPSEGLVTAANGDTIAFTLRWTAQSVESGVIEVTGPFEVTDGTGRFTGAGGGGNYLGHIDINTGNVTAEINGLLLR